MTETLADAEQDSQGLDLPTPIGLQPRWIASAASRKVLRIGRRGSKTRFALVAALTGHGPGAPSLYALDADHAYAPPADAPDGPLFPGILSPNGGDVLWVAVDYRQLTTVLWKEELEPRFGDQPWADLNAGDYDLTVEGHGTLFLRSAQALAGVRGMGKNLIGVIIDEAAHFDLEGALFNEVLPTLLDNGGWLVIMSTTNAGLDGNAEKRTPSFFNVICEAIRNGDPRFAGWEEFVGTAFDNPAISDDGIRELIGLYPQDSPQLKQEVFADLLKAGVGVALAQLDAEKHVVPRFPIPSHWTQFGALDWGHEHPWVFGWYAADEDGRVYKVDTVWGRHESPEQIATKVEAAVPVAHLRYVVGGLDLKHDSNARNVSDKTQPTLKEWFARRGWRMIDAHVGRVQGLQNLRRYVEWQPHPELGIPERTPLFTLFDTPNNRWTLRVLGAMQVDPDRLEDALKVDARPGTGADGYPVGGDDPYDETRYALMSRPAPAKALPAPAQPADRAPTINWQKGGVVKRESADAEIDRQFRSEAKVAARVAQRTVLLRSPNSRGRR